ncbi:MAG TPA: 5'/3'-nucleotidase SurE [Acidimicrobiia bacterium]|nr:5'/3'-nucleotidase SurE [Acidimicrobiia bacterium]
MRSRLLRPLAALVAAATLPAVTTVSSGAAPDHKPKVLRILVTNDDGVTAPGINALVDGLRDLERVKVTVVAPAANQSGTGDRTTPGELTTSETTTASGYPAIAVEGFPADTVDFALDGGIRKVPHVVLSGVNQGQNLGPVFTVSGTVGAARAAVRRGIPGVAVSAGLGDAPDYAAAVDEAIAWVKEHRKKLAKGDDPTDVVNINVPTCTTGEIRGLVEVPAAPTGDALAAVDCTSTLEDPPDDLVAFTNGFATLSEVPPEGPA